MAPALVLLGLASTATAGHHRPRPAAPPSSSAADPALVQAKRHFEQGLILYQEGNFGVAVAEFQAAYDAHPSAGILKNIALAQKSLFRYAEAVANLTRYLAEQARITDADRVEVNQLIAEMKALLVDVTLTVTPAGARVVVDGREVGVAPLGRLQLVGGPHLLDVTADGYEKAHRELVVVAGQPQALDVALKFIPLTGKVRITSTVIASHVSVDGKPLGDAPVSLELGIGGHLLVVTAPGYVRYQGDLAVLGGEDRTVPITLDAVPVVVKTPIYKQWWFWTAGVLVVGGVATAIAVPLSQRIDPPVMTGLGSAPVN